MSCAVTHSKTYCAVVLIQHNCVHENTQSHTPIQGHTQINEHANTHTQQKGLKHDHVVGNKRITLKSVFCLVVCFHCLPFCKLLGMARIWLPCLFVGFPTLSHYLWGIQGVFVFVHVRVWRFALPVWVMCNLQAWSVWSAPLESWYLAFCKHLWPSCWLGHPSSPIPTLHSLPILF